LQAVLNITTVDENVVLRYGVRTIFICGGKFDLFTLNI